MTTVISSDISTIHREQQPESTRIHQIAGDKFSSTVQHTEDVWNRLHLFDSGVSRSGSAARFPKIDLQDSAISSIVAISVRPCYNFVAPNRATILCLLQFCLNRPCYSFVSATILCLLQFCVCYNFVAADRATVL